MLFGLIEDNVVYVTSASTLSEFEAFKADVNIPHIVEAREADIVEMFQTPMISGMKIPPMVLECHDVDQAKSVTEELFMVALSPVRALDHQEDMIELAEVAAEEERGPDRRTLREIHNLGEHDPWAKNEISEDQIKMAERMRELREGGGLTGESFENKLNDKILKVGDIKVELDKDHNVVSVSANVRKYAVKPYLFTVEDDSFPFNDLFDELAIPENRISEMEDNSCTILMHEHQVAIFKEAMDKRGTPYGLTAVESDALDIIEGYDFLNVLYGVYSDSDLVTVTAILSETIDVSRILAQHDLNPGCRVVFQTERRARDALAALVGRDVEGRVVAINRKGDPIVSEGSSAIVTGHIDLNEEPRPWNDVGVVDEAVMENISGSEYLFVLKKHITLKTVAYIAPRVYFEQHDALWSGEIVLPKEFPDHTLIPTGEPGMFSCRNLSHDDLKNAMCRAGMVESLLFHIYINNMLTEDE